MFMEKLILLLICLIVVFKCDGQSTGVANNLYDSFQPLGCGQFFAILSKCGEGEKQLYGGDVQWTVFAPNDTAFHLLPPPALSRISSFNQDEAEIFVKAFTLQEYLLSSSFQQHLPKQSRSPHKTMIFFTSRPSRDGNTASGNVGAREYFANGARILRPDIPAGRSLIQIVDRVSDVPKGVNVLSFISRSQTNTDFYEEVVRYIDNGQMYAETVEPLNSPSLITAFIPTDEAIQKVPPEKLGELRSNPERLNEVVQSHIIPSYAVYTSFVYHNEAKDTLGQRQILFCTNVAREAVYVSSGGVIARIVLGNVTCLNGVVHFIDTMLGYVYNTARDEVELNHMALTFQNLLAFSRQDLQKHIVNPHGVTIFVPVNSAFSRIPAYVDLAGSPSLINKVVELCLTQLGTESSVTLVNGDYTARRSIVSLFHNRLIHVYSQGNETWIESGFVKARVIHPDIRVTNGYVHLIDAVPGIPSLDVPNTIFCEDWIVKAAFQFHVTGLNDFMRDRRIADLAAKCSKSGGLETVADVYTAFDFLHRRSNRQTLNKLSSNVRCGDSCRFTVFVPNGTAIEFFENMYSGQQIQADLGRWRHVLERHITKQVIYLEQTALHVERSYTALNGDSVRYKRVTDRYTYLYFSSSRKSTVYHSDIGATNGVIHIISDVIFVDDDLTWKAASSWSNMLWYSPFLVVTCLLVPFLRNEHRFLTVH